MSDDPAAAPGMRLWPVAVARERRSRAGPGSGGQAGPMRRFERSLTLPVSRAQLFAWHARPGAFERLAPTWQQLEIVEQQGGIGDGDRLHFCLRAGPLRVHWVARHEDYVEGERFVDVAERSPFAAWRHVHAFEDAGEGAATLHDRVSYRLPLDRLAGAIAGGMARRTFDRMFRQRHLRTAQDLRRHAAVADRGPQRVALTGASGLVGRELAAFLTTGGHEVVRLVRREPRGGDELRWDGGPLDLAGLEGLDAVVHLAGEPIVGRWTAAKKQRIRESRVGGTRRLCAALAELERPPRVLICASATGFYGDAGDGEVDEASPAGEGFLADVAREWEAATQAAERAGIRVVHLRLGMVMSARGGALAQLKLPFSLGLGGPIGGGRQWQSWIDLDDVLGVILHAMHSEVLRGPVNAVSPEPLRQRELARCLGKVLRRPAFMPLPAFAVRALFGELADEMLLAGARVRPGMLAASGFRWDFPDLESSLRHQLGRLDDAAVERAVASFRGERPAARSAA